MPDKIKIIRTNSDNPDFRELVRQLDNELAIRDGAEHAFYDQFNKIANIKHVVVVYDDLIPCGCGAFKEFSYEAVEIKRMFVSPDKRGMGIASMALAELENWAKELGYKKCILETGKKQPEAISLYTKRQYMIIPNFGQYEGVENSVCFQKELN